MDFEGGRVTGELHFLGEDMLQLHLQEGQDLGGQWGQEKGKSRGAEASGHSVPGRDETRSPVSRV